jgi:diguanylate cyclase (GGDEF)-like protein
MLPRSLEDVPDARPALGPAELASLRACAERSHWLPQPRFHGDAEGAYHRARLRENRWVRALLALALGIGVALFAGYGGDERAFWLVLPYAAVAGLQWWRGDEPLAERLLVLAAVPVVVAAGVVSAGMTSLVWLWLACVLVALIALPRFRVREALALGALYVVSVAIAVQEHGAPPWPLVALIALVVLGHWRDAQSRRRSWAVASLLDSQAHHDVLTGLPNRRALERHYQHLSRGPERASRATVALVLVDVDYFKCVNDSYGHEYGDRVLARIGEELGLLAAESGDFAARLAGEEFALTLSASSPLQIQRRVQEAIRRIEHLALPNRRSPYGSVTASAGWAPIIYGSAFVEPYRLADHHLYRAKHRGRNLALGPTDVADGETGDDRAASSEVLQEKRLP